MLNKYVPDNSAPGMYEPISYRGTFEQDGREGDGINMAKQAGALLVGMDAVIGNAPYLDDHPLIRQFNGPRYLRETRTALSQPFLWVNKAGNRFYNESMGAIFVEVYNAMTFNGGVMYSIFDENMKNLLIKNGPITPFNLIVIVGEKMTELDKGLQIGIKKGYAFKADTIELLAEKTGIDPENLKATVRKVNEYSEKKEDPDWGRKPEHLFKFSDKGPYYALKGIRTITGTLGGININSNMQALNLEGKVIPGLYAAGRDVGGTADRTYDLLIVEGLASGFALTGARLAAKHIVETQLSH